MQTHGGDAAAEAIAARERAFTARLLVDWNRTGAYDHPLSDMSSYCSRISTDRNLKGSAPEEITLISGAAAAELTATVSGSYDGLGLVAVFSTYNGNSPFYLDDLVGCEITYSIDVETTDGTVNYPQFVGLVRSTSPDRAEGTVEIVALDRVELLRSPLSLPSWCLSRYWANRGRVRAQLCDAQWVVDYALRQCDVSPTGQALVDPLITDQIGGANMARFFLAGTGSVAPGVGSFDNFTAQTFPDTEGGAGEMYAYDGVQPDNLRGIAGNPRPLCFANHTADYTSKYWVDAPDAIGASTTHYVSVQLATHTTSHLNVNGAPLISVRAQLHDVELYVDQGDVYGLFRDREANTSYTSSRHPIPSGLDSVWVEFGTEWTELNGLRMYFAFDQDPTPWETLPLGPPPATIPYDELSGLVTVHRIVAFNDLAYQQNYWANANRDVDTLIRPARYQAALDPSNNRYTNLPDRQGVDAWDVIGEVADAEFAAAFWDESGIFRFWTYDRVIGLQDTVVRTLTLDDVTGIQTTASLDSVRNIWSVTMKRATGVYGMVLDADDPDAVYVPGNSMATARFWVSNVIFPNPFAMARCTTIGGEGIPWNDTVRHGLVPQWLISGVWQEVSTRTLDGFITSSYVGRDGYLNVILDNDYAEPMRCATDDDNGALRVAGSYVDEQDEFTTEVVKMDSVEQYGKRNINLSGDWYQDSFQTDRLLGLISDRTADPIPATESVTIAGDPRLQLADTVEIVDPEGVGERLRLQVFGIRRAFDVDGGLTDELKVELVRPAGQGIWNSDQYGRWDETLVWS